MIAAGQEVFLEFQEGEYDPRGSDDAYVENSKESAESKSTV